MEIKIKYLYELDRYGKYIILEKCDPDAAIRQFAAILEYDNPSKFHRYSYDGGEKYFVSHGSCPSGSYPLIMRITETTIMEIDGTPFILTEFVPY